MSDDWTEDQWLAHECVWKKLYDATIAVLDRFGRMDYYDGRKGHRADYYIVDDDWGWDIVQTEVNLSLIRPDVIRDLQATLIDLPGWAISVRATLPAESKAPGMGLFVYADRIVDDLKREYLPPEFRDMRFG